MDKDRGEQVEGQQRPIKPLDTVTDTQSTMVHCARQLTRADNTTTAHQRHHFHLATQTKLK